MLCPYCAEEIKEEAKKCKHCGEWLTIKKLNLSENINLKKYHGILKRSGDNVIEEKFVYASSPDDALTLFDSMTGYTRYDENIQEIKGNGRYSCPACNSRFTKSDKEIGCAVAIIIFISFGLGLIMLPFLPHQCECDACGHRWKT